MPPPMPPMPPPMPPIRRPCRRPPGPGPAGSSSFGMSATRQEVVSSSVATLAAFCRAVRTTLAGSMMPASTRSQYVVLVGVVAVGLALHLPHAVDDHRAVLAGVLGDCPQRGVEHVADDLGPQGLVAARGPACRGPCRCAAAPRRRRARCLLPTRPWWRAGRLPSAPSAPSSPSRWRRRR